MVTKSVFGSLVCYAFLTISFESSTCFPTEASPDTPSRNLSCPAGCHVSCRGSTTASPTTYCYCRCKPPTIHYGTLVYTAVVDDIWQVQCGYLGHPFMVTALAMNETGLLDEFAVTKCESDYTEDCRSGELDEICTQSWARSLCMETCAEYISNSVSTTTDTPTDRTGDPEDFCPPDIYFRTHRPSFGNPYTGCADMQMDCVGLYDRGYCQLRPTAMNCQETCGRCVGDEEYMPWNPIRSQLIQWALNRRDDGTANALITYYTRQYSDYVTEVHRSCRQEASSIESVHRQRTVDGDQ